MFNGIVVHVLHDKSGVDSDHILEAQSYDLSQRSIQKYDACFSSVLLLGLMRLYSQTSRRSSNAEGSSER